MQYQYFSGKTFDTGEEQLSTADYPKTISGNLAAVPFFQRRKGKSTAVKADLIFKDLPVIDQNHARSDPE